MKQRLFALIVAVPWLLWLVATLPAEELPTAVEPGLQERRFLPPRLPTLQLRLRLPRSGLVVPEDLDCTSGSISNGTRFTLRGIVIESDVNVRDTDPVLYWRPLLGEEVSLDKVCAIAQSLAKDYARRSGRVLRALVPAQLIAEGMVHIRISAPGATVPPAD